MRSLNRLTKAIFRSKDRLKCGVGFSSLLSKPKRGVGFQPAIEVLMKMAGWKRTHFRSATWAALAA